MFMPALFTGRLFDLGYFHSIALPASAVQIAGTFLVAECTHFWHFLLCQGILIGVRWPLPSRLHLRLRYPTAIRRMYVLLHCTNTCTLVPQAKRPRDGLLGGRCGHWRHDSPDLREVLDLEYRVSARSLFPHLCRPQAQL